jgi:hypothetical protein
LISGLEEDFMGLKATAYGTLCLTALSLCLCLAGGCGSNIPPPAPGKAPRYFGKGVGGFGAPGALMKEVMAKNKAKAKAKPKAKAK